MVLKAKLQKDFGLILPEVEENQKPEDYFEKLTESIKSRKRWSLKRYITFGTFDFHRMAMYNDLDPKNWSNLGSYKRSEIEAKNKPNANVSQKEAERRAISNMTEKQKERYIITGEK